MHPSNYLADSCSKMSLLTAIIGILLHRKASSLEQTDMKPIFGLNMKEFCRCPTFAKADNRHTREIHYWMAQDTM